MKQITKQKKPSSQDFSSLKEVSTNINLREVRLRKASVSYEGEVENSPLIDCLEINFMPSYQKTGENILLVLIEFRIKAENSRSMENSKQAPEKKAVLSVGGEFELEYSLDFGKIKGKKGLQLFCELNAPFNVWPYIRELAQNLSARMGIGPITIPLHHHGFEKQKKFTKTKPDK